MIEEKELHRLYERSELFRYYMKNKQYIEAKRCYDETRNEMVRMKADEKIMIEFFGERGERGVILKEGLFREEMVQKAYYEVAVKRDENRQHEHWQKNSA